ncbi:hypothetical protein RRG08_059151 [Elysia crispata]|uniref:Uncharacterized protein n=1 Tax=Elysia crispata TaxID=231223 RepID=A0AAE0ZVE9_9GAST|nr:hypothetical protein RRG08_059151 [Elysia crispata]
MDQVGQKTWVKSAVKVSAELELEVLCLSRKLYDVKRSTRHWHRSRFVSSSNYLPLILVRLYGGEKSGRNTSPLSREQEETDCIEVEITRDLIFETSVECRRLLRMGVVEILPGSSWRRISSLLEQVNCMTQPNVNFRHGRVTGTEGFRELSRSTHRAMIQLKSLCRKPG